MPWKITGVKEERWRFVEEYLKRKTAVAELSRRWGISRKTAHKWIGRLREGGRGALKDRSREARRVHNRPQKRWLDRIRRWRRTHPSWGAPKLHAGLRRRFGGEGLPSEAAIGRWLKAWSLTKKAHPQKRRRKGPSSVRPALTVPKRCHEVWTADFKGWFMTGDDGRVDPPTVRDLFSRYVLEVELMRKVTLEKVKEVFRRIFKRHGLPEVIRTDNGTPFGSTGALGLTRLSAWWLKLGIRVEFIEPGRPDQNGAHEQVHRVYKAETAQPPAGTLRGQRRRTRRWLRIYNDERPHEALGMRVPSDLFEPNPRRLPRKTTAWAYPPSWNSRLVKGKGMISLYGRGRYIGEAFEGERVGLKAADQDSWEVYLGPHLLGELRRDSTSGILARWYHPRSKKHLNV